MTLNAISQDRIGVHPRNWGVPLPVPLDEVDEGIRDAVVVLNAGGFETYQSCQGGVGHSFAEPTVQFHGEISEGLRAVSWCQTYGMPVLALHRLWYVLEGELTGPTWEIVFKEAVTP
jgi:hypothetical protein